MSEMVSLKIPYGIWNTNEELDRIMESVFEDSLWDLKLGVLATSMERYRFEDSLWDLKPISIPAAMRERAKVWRFPMGFETKSAADNNTGNFPVWRFPMGFETFVCLAIAQSAWVWRFPMGFETLTFHTHLSLPCCLKIPYGIWNFRFIAHLFKPLKFEDSLWDLKLGHQVGGGSGKTVWRFPMGFETA